jgi:hypothetical protein
MDRERLRHQLLVEPAVDIVLDALAPFVDHDVALGLDRRWLEHEVLHALGFEPHAERQVACGEREPVVRPVDPRRRVRLATRALDEPIVLVRWELLGLREHQVLEQMRHARRARALVARADAKPRLQRNDRRTLVDLRDQGEPVREPKPPSRSAAPDRTLRVELPRLRHLIVDTTTYDPNDGSIVRPATLAISRSAGAARRSSPGASMPSGPVVRVAITRAIYAVIAAVVRYMS